MSLKSALQIFLCIAASVFPGLAQASGPIEIGPACATSGCMPGDAPGLPITIGEPGSYRLTGNLVQTSPAVDAILIEASDVWLDMGGFHISGSCAGDPPCAPQGVGAGIRSAFPTVNVTVRNGSLRNISGHGIDLPGDHHRVEGVVVNRTGGSGLSLGSGYVHTSQFLRNAAYGVIFQHDSIVADCQVSLNGLQGIASIGAGAILVRNVARGNLRGIYSIGGEAVVADNQLVDNLEQGLLLLGNGVVGGNVARGNGAAGIEASTPDSVLVRNVSAQNGGHGISGLEGTVAIDNLASENEGDGIHTASESLATRNQTFDNGVRGVFVNVGSIARENTSRSNGDDGLFANDSSNVSENAASENTGHGISVNGRSRIFGNTSRDNTRTGLRMQSNTGFSENLSSGNGEGETSGGTAMGTNMCGTNVVCP